MDSQVNPSTVQSIELKYQISIPSALKIARFLANPERGPKFVLFSGGSGASMLSRALVRYTHNSAHIIPVFDSGGSSRVLRQAFNMESPGDLRNRIMDLADMTSEGNPEVANLFRTRLSKSLSNERLQMELDALVAGSHPLLQGVEPGLVSIIRVYLERFSKAKPVDFDLHGGSIGNFVLTGSYLMYNRDIESALHVISSLTHVRGTVVPVARGSYHLAADLNDGSRIVGQARITSGTGWRRLPIRKMSIVDREEQNADEIKVPANPRALEQLGKADVIVYAIGSFYTSVIPNLLAEGIGRRIRQTRVPKILIANATEDLETEGLTVSQLAAEIIRYATLGDPEPGNPHDYLNIVIANHHGNARSYRGREGYIPVDMSETERMGLGVLEFPLELPTERGRYDPELLAQILLSFANA